MRDEKMYERAIGYLEAIKAVAPVANFFAADASIVSHKLGKMTAAEYEAQLLESRADISQICIGDAHSSGNLLSLHIQFALRPELKRQYVDVFEFDSSLLISNLYLCRVSQNAFHPCRWITTI